MYIYVANIIVLTLLHYFFYYNNKPILENYCWIFFIFLLTIFVGLRYEVGGDWYTYYGFYSDYNNAFHGEEPDVMNIMDYINHSLVYVAINKIAYFMKIEVVGVNLICSFIFMTALSIFIYNSRNRWLALVVSFPIIIVVLAMGYTRQGLAFSFSLLLLKSLEEQKLFKSLIYLILALFSHQSALIIFTYIIFYLIYYKRYSDLKKCLVALTIVVAFFWEKIEHLLYFYVGTGQHMISIGSLPRATIIFSIACIFLFINKKNLYMTKYQIFIYNYFSYMIIIIYPFSILISVTADRMLLYLYALKLAFVSSADLNNKTMNIIIFFITSIYTIYLLVWLAFGKNSPAWVPYNSIVF